MNSDALEDCLILIVLAATSMLLASLLWWCFGRWGCLGALSGYVVGLLIYCSPFPET